MAQPIHLADPSRFWAKVDRSAGPNACWPWLGKKDRDGYGEFEFKARPNRWQWRAHRFAYQPTCPISSVSRPSSCDPATHSS